MISEHLKEAVDELNAGSRRKKCQMVNEQLKNDYFEKKEHGMDFSEIRRELQRKGHDDAEIREIVAFIDDRLLENIRTQNADTSSRTNQAIGVALVVIGVFLTVSTYLGWINLGNVFIFAYGPILGGFAMIASTRLHRATLFDRPKRKWR